MDRNRGGLPSPLALLPGTLLTDESWLSERVDQIGRESGCVERRTNATLWWYSASVVLLGPAVHEMVATGTGVSLSPSAVRFTTRASGYLERVIAGAQLDPGPVALGRHLDDVLDLVIEPLARVGGATQRSLWAIAVDSLATRVLAETAVAPGGTDRAPQLATAVAEAAPRLRPLPRYLDVPGRPGSPDRRYVQRGSCCLLFRVPAGLCISCPKQTPADRLTRLQQHARSTG
ncbi:MAG TPA: (2Fe-2S)-binding protein [Kineosporiaceae bacterium]|nr:(2Fe-2S)-binding protein [Kineosporiaceae bacterium]